MNITELAVADLIGMFLSFAFTLLVFSYFLGDNPLFRFAIHIFIGVAAGFAAVIAWYNVIWPQLILPLFIGSTSERIFVLFPLVLSIFLLLKISARTEYLGSPGVAYLVGVGVATAIGGGILGTLFPQSGATINLFDLDQFMGGQDLVTSVAESSIILVGTLSTLAYFQFGVRPKQGQPPERSPVMEGAAWLGQIFIAIAFGALFAGVYAASLSALIERLNFFVEFLIPLFQPG